MSGRDDKYDDAVSAWARETYPNINWQAVTDLNRMINWELWHGPLPSDYWTDVEPSETPWPGDWTVAAARLIIELEPLPDQVWVDSDECVYESDPNDDEAYWAVEYECTECDERYDTLEDAAKCHYGIGGVQEGEPYWIGPDSFRTVNVRHALLHHEVYQHVF